MPGIRLLATLSTAKQTNKATGNEGFGCSPMTPREGSASIKKRFPRTATYVVTVSTPIDPGCIASCVRRLVEPKKSGGAELKSVLYVRQSHSDGD
jgi:hypothetical protein